jgi:hypothetical protein
MQQAEEFEERLQCIGRLYREGKLEKQQPKRSERRVIGKILKKLERRVYVNGGSMHAKQRKGSLYMQYV